MTLDLNHETSAPTDMSSGLPSPGSGHAAEDFGLLDEQPRKLAILGLPWETTEDTLRLHFSQYGVVEAAEIMKDRFTGKSRGFGFVTFVDPAAAQRALTMDHTVDGRRCEAKIALPKTLLQGADPVPARTTRIFVARIPASVTETQFRGYFEKYGRLQDAYMPKDHSKQAYRGIGFVTFASPDSVEKVMANKHWMNGHEVAIDRATPKDDSSAGKHFMRPTPTPTPVCQRRSFDNGSGLVGPSLTPLLNYQPMGGLGNDPMAAAAFQAMRALSGDQDMSVLESAAAAAACAAAVSAAQDMAGGGRASFDAQGRPSFDGGRASFDAGRASFDAGSCNGLGMPVSTGALTEEDLAKGGAGRTSSGSLGLLNGLGGNSMASHMAFMQQVAKAQAQLGAMQGQMQGLGGMHGLPQLGGLSLDNNSGLFGGFNKPAAAPMGGGRKSLDSAMHHIPQPPAPSRRSMESPAIVNARSGPRIFIGKLTKDTSEADVKEYFSRFGYVMDVYMPKSKDNKVEHRGFGFVTFETDAAIKRVVGAGSHKLKGSTIAIDIAIPKVEEEVGGDLSAAFGAGAGLGAPLGLMPPFDPTSAAAAAAAAVAARQFQAQLPMMM